MEKTYILKKLSQYNMHIFILGVIFGFGNAISLGPSLYLLAARSLQFGWKAGCVVAFSPLIFGIIIVPVFLLFSTAIRNNYYLVGLISIGGACYLLKLAIQNFKYLSYSPERKIFSKNNFSVYEALLINFSSPHAYLFWLMIGTPIMAAALSHHNILQVFYFITGYYVSMVTTKMAIAYLFSKISGPIIEKYMKWIIKFVSIIFIIFSLLLFFEGIESIFYE